MSELVIVRTFNNIMDFEVAKSYLESCGVICFGQDEIYSKGGVKLQVIDNQAEDAIKLLLEGGYLKPEDFESSPEMKWMEKVLDFFRRK